jgi:phosphoribosylformylglycinamidine synthase
MRMFDVRVTVRLKKGVSDPEGNNTEKALHLLGFNQIRKVTTFRVFDMKIEGTNEKEIEKSAEQMCRRLLTNPIIHDYEINIEKI